MFAEVAITVAEPLSPTLEAEARAGLAPLVPPHVALAQTGLGDVAGNLPAILAAKMLATHVVLVSRHDEVGLDAYVELANVPIDLRRLKTVAEATAGDLMAFLTARGYRPTSARIGISAEGILLESGAAVFLVPAFARVGAQGNRGPALRARGYISCKPVFRFRRATGYGKRL